MVSRWILILMSSTVFGCAAPREYYQPRSIAISRPALNQETIARPGDNLLQQGKQSEYDALECSVPVTFSALSSFTLSPGRYIKASETSSYEVFIQDDADAATRTSAPPQGDLLQELILLKSGKGAIIKTIGGRLYGADNPPLRRVKAIVFDRDSFQQTLLYSGKVGNRINLSYREFAGGMARSAFTNTAEYDLSESNVIGYQGAQIEVIEATNQFIRYRLLSNFSKAVQ